MLPSEHRPLSVPDLSHRSLRAFLTGMPESYRVRHGEDEIRAHAEVCVRRGEALVRIGRCPGPKTPEPAEWLCVVADDRPGLLSLLSASISANSLDILGARVYCRARSSKGGEAVDLFAVRRLKDPALPIQDADLDSIQRTSESLLRGDIDLASLEKHAAQTSRPTGLLPTAVYFADAREGNLLIVEAPDRPGLLLAITLTVYRERLTIARSHVTTFAGSARDEFEIVETNGTALDPGRKSALIEKIHEALDRTR